MDEQKVVQSATEHQITWKFNPPSAPDMGGAWERLVRSTKEVLCSLMSENVLTDAQLYTAFTEVERIINSRPLTHSSDHIADHETLTPNHILLCLHLAAYKLARRISIAERNDGEENICLN